MAEFLQQGAAGEGEIELAVVELVAIHIDPLRARVAHGGIGGQGAVQLGIAAQLHLDAQTAAPEAVEQRLQVGCKRSCIGAGLAEHLLQELIAVGAGEQVGQGAAGIAERLLPQSLGGGAEQRGAVVHQHVLLWRLRAAAEGHQQRLAGACGAITHTQLEVFAAAGADSIEAPVALRLEVVFAGCAVEIERAVGAGRAQVVGDALEAHAATGAQVRGVAQAVGEGCSSGIGGGEGAAGGGEAVLRGGIHQVDRGQVGQFKARRLLCCRDRFGRSDQRGAAATGCACRRRGSASAGGFGSGGLQPRTQLVLQPPAPRSADAVPS